MTEDIRDFRRFLRYLERFIMTNLKDDSMCCGVTPNQCHILLETAEKGEVDISDLTSYLGLDKSSISRTVDSLVNTGLLLRKAKQEDRRYQRVSLSDKGLLFVEGIDAQCDLHYSLVFNALPDKVRKRITEDLQALSEAFIKVPEITGERSCCDPNSLSSSDTEGGRNGG